MGGLSDHSPEGQEAQNMDVFDLLRQKEAEMARLQKEMEALRIVADMMRREEGLPAHGSPSSQPASVPEPAGKGGKALWP